METMAKTPQSIAPVVTPQDIMEAVESVPPGFVKASKTVAGCTRVISEILGGKWVEQRVVAGRLGFFQLDIADSSTLQSRVHGMARVRELAELMLNLQSIEGFHERVREFQTADETKLESAFAELQIAGLMHQHELPFRFLPARQDFEVYVSDDVTIRVEAKCKLEGATVSMSSVLNSLRQAAKQVPGDGPATLFVKIPQSWHDSGKMVPEELAKATFRFFGKSGRVISVVYYSTFFDHYETGRVSHSDASEEVENHRSRFRSVVPRLLREHGHTNPSWINLIRLIHGDSANWKGSI
jgi:hypothetical protein